MNNKIKYGIIGIIILTILGIASANIVTSTTVLSSVTVNGQPWNTQINVAIPLVAGSAPTNTDYVVHNNADQALNVTFASTYKNQVGSVDGNIVITYSPASKVIVPAGADVNVTVSIYAKPTAIGNYTITTTTTPS